MPHSSSKHAKQQPTNASIVNPQRILHLKRSPLKPLVDTKNLGSGNGSKIGSEISSELSCEFGKKNSNKNTQDSSIKHSQTARADVANVEVVRPETAVSKTELENTAIVMDKAEITKIVRAEAVSVKPEIENDLPQKARPQVNASLICSQYTPCIMQVLTLYKAHLDSESVVMNAEAFIKWMQQILTLGEGWDAQPYAACALLLQLASDIEKNDKAPAKNRQSSSTITSQDSIASAKLPDALAAFWEGIQIAHRLLSANRLPQNMNRTTYMHQCRTVAAASEEFGRALQLGCAQASLILYSLENFEEKLQSRLTLKSQKASRSTFSSSSTLSSSFATQNSERLYQMMFGSELKLTTQTSLQQALQQCSPALAQGFALHYLPAVQLLIERLLLQKDAYASTLEHMLWSYLEHSDPQSSLYQSQLEASPAEALSKASILHKQPRSLLLDPRCSLLEPVRLDLEQALHCLHQVPPSAHMSQVLYTLAQLYLSHYTPSLSVISQPLTNTSNIVGETSIYDISQSHKSPSAQAAYITAQNSTKLTFSLLQSAVKALDDSFPQQLTVKQAVNYVLDPSVDAMCRALQEESRNKSPNNVEHIKQSQRNNQRKDLPLFKLYTASAELSYEDVCKSGDNKSVDRNANKRADSNVTKSAKSPCLNDVQNTERRVRKALIIDSSVLLGRLSAIAAWWDLAVLYFQVPHVALNPSSLSWGKKLFPILVQSVEAITSKSKSSYAKNSKVGYTQNPKVIYAQAQKSTYAQAQMLSNDSKLNFSLGQRALERFLLLQSTRLGTAKQRALGWNLYLSQIAKHHLNGLSFVRSLGADPAAYMLLSYLYLGGISVRCDFVQAFAYCQQALELILQQDKNAHERTDATKRINNEESESTKKSGTSNPQLNSHVQEPNSSSTQGHISPHNAPQSAKSGILRLRSRAKQNLTSVDAPDHTYAHISSLSSTDEASRFNTDSRSDTASFTSVTAPLDTADELKDIRNQRQGTGFLQSVLQDTAKLTRNYRTEHRDYKTPKHYKIITLDDLQAAVEKEQQTKDFRSTFGAKPSQLMRTQAYSLPETTRTSSLYLSTSEVNRTPSELPPNTNNQNASVRQVLSLRRKAKNEKSTNSKQNTKTELSILIQATSNSKNDLKIAVDGSKLPQVTSDVLDKTQTTAHVEHDLKINSRKSFTADSKHLQVDLESFEVEPKMLEKALSQLPESLYLHGMYIPRSDFTQPDHYAFLLPEIFAMQTGLYLRGYGIGQNSEQAVCALQRWLLALDTLPLVQAVFLCDKTEWMWSWLDQPKEKFVQYVQKQAAHGDKAAILLLSACLAYGLLGLKIDLKKSQYWADLATKHHTMAFKPQRKLVRFMQHRWLEV